MLLNSFLQVSLSIHLPMGLRIRRMPRAIPVVTQRLPLVKPSFAGLFREAANYAEHAWESLVSQHGLDASDLPSSGAIVLALSAELWLARSRSQVAREVLYLASHLANNNLATKTSRTQHFSEPTLLTTLDLFVNQIDPLATLLASAISPHAETQSPSLRLPSHQSCRAQDSCQ